MDGLRCPVPGCKHTVRALTGLQEIEKLKAHYKKAHLARITTQEALEIRVRIEKKEFERGL